MKKNICFFIGLICLCVFFSCESMEDTYSEYAKDGKNKYIGACYNLEVSAGWNRILLNWENSIDVDIENIKIVWSCLTKTDSVVIASDATEFSTDADLLNDTYEFKIYALDSNKQQSIPVVTYARPYTVEHELVRNFGSVFERYFFVKDNLILFLSGDSAEMIDPHITYWSNGEKIVKELTEDDFRQRYMTIENVDKDKDVLVKRKAVISECIDELDIPEYVLDRNFINFKSKFSKVLKETYNLDIVTSEFVDTLQTLYINYPVESIEDILNFKNLKKVVFGAHRYFDPSCKKPFSILEDRNNSDYAVQEAMKYMDIEIESFNDIWFFGLNSFTPKSMGNTELPELQVLNTSDWTIECSTQEPGYNAHEDNLLDNDVNTIWEPLSVEGKLRKHSFFIDMQSVNNVKGFLIRLPKDDFTEKYLPKLIRIQVSEDNSTYNEILNYSDIRIGEVCGESTLINLSEMKSIRYIKFEISDQLYFRRNAYLADFVVLGED